jgi:pantoate kinase
MSRSNPRRTSAAQERAIAALLQSPTVKHAAAAANVSERTLHRWLKEPVFAAAFREARREAFAQAVGLTQRYAPLAVQSLAKMLTDDTAPHAPRVASATALLKFARESIELGAIVERLENVERLQQDFPRLADDRGGQKRRLP